MSATQPNTTWASQDPGPRVSLWRTFFISVSLFGMATVLTGRLLHIHFRMQSQLSEWAHQQQVLVETVPAIPGSLLDRSGLVLATTESVPSLYVVPKAIEDFDAFSEKLAPPLRLDPEQLRERIASRKDRWFVWIKRRLSSSERMAIESLDLDRRTFGFRDEFERSFPQGDIAAHVIGLRDIDGTPRGGMEERFNDVLRGKDGQREIIRDAFGHVISIVPNTCRQPERGADVTLTIDSVIQRFVEDAADELADKWDPKGACIIVMEPHTGDILAMTSRPTYSPSRPADAPSAAWKNRAVSAVYEPGSTFKPFIVAWAMQQNLLQRDETIYCENGAYRMGPRVLHDHHRYGHLSVTDILVKSSNIGMAKIGERLKNEGIYDAIRSFGFGSRTGIEIAGEIEGLVRPLTEWNRYSTGSIPMGQEIAATPLQVITATSVLANGGTFVQPRLVDHIRTNERAPSVKNRIIDESIANWLIQNPLHEVVTRGTGTNGDVPGFKTFGKTGTSQKYDAELGAYSKTKAVCSFICGGPIHHPDVVILVVADEPTKGTSHFGGTVAAPYAAEILEKTFEHRGIRPQTAIDSQ